MPSGDSDEKVQPWFLFLPCDKRQLFASETFREVDGLVIDPRYIATDFEVVSLHFPLQ